MMTIKVVVADSQLKICGVQTAGEYVQRHIQAEIEVVDQVRLAEKCATIVWYRTAK